MVANSENLEYSIEINPTPARKCLKSISVELGRMGYFGHLKSGDNKNW